MQDRARQGRLPGMERRSWYRMGAAPEGPQFDALLDFALARRAHYPTFLLVQRGLQDAGLFGADGAPAKRLAAGSVHGRVHAPHSTP